MNYSLKRYIGRLCGSGAIALPLSVLSLTATAQQPLVQDLSNSSTNASNSSFYQQTQRQEASSGNLVLFNQVQEHQQEIQQLRGQIEELRHQLEQLRRQSQQQYLDIEDRLMSSGPTQIEQSTPAQVVPVLVESCFAQTLQGSKPSL
ncbi:YbgF trimerization domain-containing protein [Halomonas sp. SBBP1]|uniref:YbgF trimerization domain-containing protein n=1 Tax=Halomonas sp. SBBP1 TaxID=2599306 RepID=UPI00299DD9FA|nr:YbgF trimerization domain-containing protein [Halomonas sp. SBBP1]